MSEIKRPYVGISGVTTPEMQSQLEQIAEATGLFATGRRLALGVKAVHKTQWLDTENKYGSEWYPVGRTPLRQALRHDNDNPDTVAVAQTYLDINEVHQSAYRQIFTSRVIERSQPWIQAIQFDMLPWHSNREMLYFLEGIKTHHGLEIFLQCHKEAMEQLGPKGVVRQLGRHAGLVDYLLFDSSHGTGTRLDTAKLKPFIAEAHDKLDMSETGVALAGGLNGQVILEELPELLIDYPDLSWDAEGQLHPLNIYGKRPLDMPTVQKYIQASSDVLFA